jgi:radical SAM superfamily enzyme YgiQ (UPF0313 family)
MEAYITMSMQTSRGCPFDCEFCDVVRLLGRKPRYKSADRVISELEYLDSLGWRGDIFVTDDNFIGSKKHAKRLLGELIPWMETHGKPFGFWTQTSLNLGRDQEIMDRMTLANFHTVIVGIESPDEEVLKLAGKLQNVRDPLEEMLTNICASGLSIVGSFIIGFDGEEKGVDDRIMALVEKTHLPAAMLNLLQAGPNTRLWDRLQRENRLLEARTSGQSVGGSGLNFVPTRPETEIIDEYVSLTQRMYEPSGFMRRAYRYYLTMRPTRRALAREQGRKPVNATPKRKLSLGRSLRDLNALITILWRRGVVAPYRMQFWKQLIGICRHNPSRIKAYFLSLGMGENLFPLREMVRKSSQAS